MSSNKLDFLINQFPEEGGSIDRLSCYLDSIQSRSVELPIGRIYDLIKPSSLGVLAAILSSLEQQGIVKRVIRIESDGIGGIGDFESVTDVPKSIWDSRLGRDVEVRLDQINLLYKLG